MTVRSALRQSPWITFGVVAAFLWFLFTGVRVLDAIELARAGAVGQGAISGVVGLVVIAITLGLLVALFGELSQPEPGPESWPPRE